MPAPFFRTLRSIEAETKHRSIAAFVIAILFLAGWSVWFVMARIHVVEVGTARLEVDRVAHSVDAPIAGRVIEHHLVLDAEIHQGDLLVSLDASADALKLGEAKARKSGIEAKLEAVLEQRKVAERLATVRRDVHAAKVDEAKAHTKEATSGATHAENEVDRATRLHAEGLLSAADFAKLKADAQVKRATVDARKTAAFREVAELRANDTEFALDIVRLAERTAELTMLRDEEDAVIKALEHAIEQHRIRSPIDGRIGEIAVIGAGTMLERGARVATIVPFGKLRAIAHLPPRNALGRVRPGQSAHLRIDGFSWAEYGTISASVTHVAAEPRDGNIRVELGVLPSPDCTIPMQHGLPGSVEIEVENVSPLSLVLRTAGRYLRPEGGSP